MCQVLRPFFVSYICYFYTIFYRTTFTNILNGTKVIGLSVDITRCLGPSPCLVTLHSCSQFSSVDIASQNDFRLPTHGLKAKRSQTDTHSFHGVREIKKAMMTPSLTLLCDNKGYL